MGTDPQDRDHDAVSPTPRHFEVKKPAQAVPLSQAQETYRPKLWWLLSGTFGAIGILGLLSSLEDPLADPLWVLVFAVSTLAGWRLGCTRIVATPEFLTVVGLLVVRRIRWSDVTDVHADEAGVRIEVRGGKTCTAYIFFSASEGGGPAVSSDALKTASRLRQLAAYYGAIF